MESVTVSEKEIKSCLSTVLETEDIENANITLMGTSEKGSGQFGDVIFVNVAEPSEKQYNIAIKCSASNTALMAQSPAIRDAFRNEIYVYEQILPTFKKFQIDRGITDPFNSVAKYYGSYSDDVKDVIALENLIKSGYVMWDPCKPLTRNHIDLVVKEYAKFHAISLAMQEVRHELYEKLVDGVSCDVFRKVFRTYSAVIYFKNSVEQLHDLLKEDLDQNTLKQWLGFKEKIHHICFDMATEGDDLEVITHGDCWNNNFMYKYETEDRSLVSAVAILDWQISRIASPINDLSYFLFACIAEEDLFNMNTVLKKYHESLCLFVSQLGGTLGEKYTLDKFLEEWKKFSKFGIMMSITLLKNSFRRRHDFPDLVNQNDYKNRVKPIVTYVVEKQLI